MIASINRFKTIYLTNSPNINNYTLTLIFNNINGKLINGGMFIKFNKDYDGNLSVQLAIRFNFTQIARITIPFI